MQTTRISVIIPCYNQSDYLSEAISSVFEQEFQDFEIIIVNDGSTDSTEEVSRYWKEKDSRVSYIYQYNRGLSSARHSGILASKGNYILPLDADDKICNNYLQKSLYILEREKDISIVYGKARYFGGQNHQWELPDFNIQDMLLQNLIFCSAVFRKSDYMKTGGYNTNMKYGWEDWDLWLSMIEKGAKVYKLDEIIFLYRVKEQSMVKDIALNSQKRQYLEQQLIINHSELYKEYFPEPLSMLRELKALKKEKENYETYKKEIHNSLSYKLGSSLLSPFKIISRLVIKSKAKHS